MPDMLARLYALPDVAPYEQRCAGSGISVRRLEVWDQIPLRRFIIDHFDEGWASEASLAFSHGHPITGFAAIQRGAIVGFAVFECTRRGYFGPTGVREDLRGSGAGALMLMRCLEAMREFGYAYAIIGGVGPAEFYAKVAGATVIEGSDPGMYGDLYREGAARRADTHP
jgi:GNAT superfamily N-acetyltransferase